MGGSGEGMRVPTKSRTALVSILLAGDSGGDPQLSYFLGSYGRGAPQSAIVGHLLGWART